VGGRSPVSLHCRARIATAADCNALAGESNGRDNGKSVLMISFAPFKTAARRRVPLRSSGDARLCEKNLEGSTTGASFDRSKLATIAYIASVNESIFK